MVRARYTLGIIICSVEGLQSITIQTSRYLSPLFLLPTPTAPFPDYGICADPVHNLQILPVFST